MTEEENKPGQLHTERIESGDGEASYQASKESARPMTAEMAQTLFNPDGAYDDVTVQSRVDDHVNSQTYEDLTMQAQALQGGYFPLAEYGMDQAGAQELLNATHQRLEEFKAQPGHKETAPRPVTMRAGMDPSTGQGRMIQPGEDVNEQGVIEMINPQYAAEAAERMRNIDPATAKQSMRRQTAFRTLANVVLNPVLDPTGVQLITLDDEQYGNLVQEYREAKAAGYSDSQIEFIPMSSYAHKIWPDGKKPLRPKLSNECGWFNSDVGPQRLRGKIACLKSASLTPQIQSQVPRKPAPAIPGQRLILDKNGNPIANQQLQQPQVSSSVSPTVPSLISPPPISSPSGLPLEELEVPSLEDLGLPPPPPK